MHRKAITYTLILIFIFSINTSSGVEFNATSIKIKFVDNYTSDTLNVTLENLPELNEGEQLTIVFDEGTSKPLTQGLIDYDSNVIAITNNMRIVLSTANDEITVFEHEVPSGVIVHMRHVYANWTFGQPPPLDRRGLGQGVMFDLKILNSSLPTSFATNNESSTLGESILNLLTGEQIDYNGDNSINRLSDGFGLIEYTYGMRDHINNAGKAADAPIAVTELAENIVNSMNETIEVGNIGNFLQNLNSTDTRIGKLYQSAFNLTQISDISTLNLELNTFRMILDETIDELESFFFTFRNEVIGFETVVNEMITFIEPISSSSIENSSVTSFLLILLGSICIPILRRSYR